jgi:hypothetical protein
MLIAFERLLLPLQDYRVRKGCRTSRDLTITFWNEIILDEIIENHILKSRELKVNITSVLVVLSIDKIPRNLCGLTCTLKFMHT